jgi:hypothetical protein
LIERFVFQEPWLRAQARSIARKMVRQVAKTKIGRSVITGKFRSVASAKKNERTSVVETIKRGGTKKKGRAKK